MSASAPAAALRRSPPTDALRRALGVLPLRSWFFYLLLVLGTAGRIVLIFTPFFQPSSDHAIVYLMARHVAHGEFPAFYWGQSYGGTLLQLLSGIVMLALGEHIEVVFIIAVLFWAAAAWFTRAAAKAMLDGPAGDAAGILTLLPGIGGLTLSVLDPGFYGPSFAFAMAVVWLVVRGGPAKPYWVWAQIGLLWGVLFWQAISGAALSAPFLVWQLVRQRSWRHWLAGAAGVVVGAEPWTLQIAGGGHPLVPETIYHPVSNLLTYLTQTVPAFFLPGGAPGPAWYRALLVMVIGCLVVALVAVSASRRRLAPLLFVAGSVLCYVAVAVGAGIILSDAQWRYGAFLLPLLAVAAGWALTRVGAGAYLALALGLWITLPPLTVDLGRLEASGATRWQSDVADVGAYLHAHDVRAGLADYWFAYRYTAAEDERSVFSGIMPDRYPPYDKIVASRRPAAVVVNAGYGNDQLLQKALGSGAERTVIDGWAVYLLPDGVAGIRDLPWGWV